MQVYGSFNPTNKATLIELSKNVGIIMEMFAVQLLFCMIETKYIHTYLKLNFISTVSKCLFCHLLI